MAGWTMYARCWRTCTRTRTSAWYLRREENHGDDDDGDGDDDDDDNDDAGGDNDNDDGDGGGDDAAKVVVIMVQAVVGEGHALCCSRVGRSERKKQQNDTR